MQTDPWDVAEEQLTPDQQFLRVIAGDVRKIRNYVQFWFGLSVLGIVVMVLSTFAAVD